MATATAIGGTAATAFDRDALGAQLGIGEAKGAPTGWFAKLVAFYLRHRQATEARRKAVVDHRPASDKARLVIRSACIKSALTGSSAGMVSTGATLFTAGTEGTGGLIAIPVAIVAIAGEMAVRSLIHVDLICKLADIFGIEFDADDRDDLWRLCALAFRTHEHEASEEDPGKMLVHELTHIDGEEISEKIGQKILGESVMRNIVPVASIATSAITNYRVTQRLGDTTRRYMRYQRALGDALAQASVECAEQLDLLIEGMWFIFIADGQLAPEESAILAGFLKRLEPSLRHLVIHRFVEDEYDWLERLPARLSQDMRPTFFHALEVAAAVDKVVGVPERRLLRSAARRLEIAFDPKRIETMISEFEEHGILSGGAGDPKSTRPPKHG